MTEDRQRLDVVVNAADELIGLVRAVTLDQTRGDTSGLVMYGAYRVGFRRFLAIRNLANEGWANDAHVLTRSLVSILARAAWIDSPADKTERRDRFRRFLRRQYEDDLNELELEAAAGVERRETEIDSARNNLQELLDDGVRAMPPDRQLFEALQLDTLYARIYAPASGSTHFSLSNAILDMLDVEEVPLEPLKYNDAADVLLRAMLAYGTLLLASDRTIHHGLTDAANDVGRRLQLALDEIDKP